MSQKRRSRRSEHKWGQLRIVNSVLLIFFAYDRELGDLYHVGQ